MNGADDALTAPVVADRLARGLYSTGERGLAHPPVPPDGVEQFLLRHHPVAVPDQSGQSVEDLRLDRSGPAGSAQLEPVEIELAVVERVDQRIPPVPPGGHQSPIR